MNILRPIFGRGVAQRRLGAEVPELHQKFPLSLGAPAVPKAQNWSSQKCCLGPPPLKGKILRSGEWERGKFDFDHYFAFLTNFLKIENFLLNGIWFSSSRGSFSKKNLSKTDLPFKFCKIGLKNTLFISGRKMVVCCFVVLFCCFVVLFIATLSDFGLLFFLIEALIELRKML